MKTLKYFLVAALLVAGLPGLKAQGPSGTKVEPGAMEALNKMSGYLRTLKLFQVTAEITDEDVLEDGQKTQSTRTTVVLAKPPDKVYVTIESDNIDRMMFYDGKSFTLFARRAGYYATVDAPPTIAELTQVAYDKYGIEFPLVDLFRFGTDKVDTSLITSAMDIGAATVEQITCEQYAFRQPGLDWQIWIQQGEVPLPKKMVLTTTTDDARPQYSAVLTWNLGPSFNEETFTFVPPEDAKKIVFATAKAGN